MAFGKGLSADTNGGWQNHHRRLRRWEKQSRDALQSLPESDFHEAVDFSLAYFLRCHSLFEWLRERGAAGKAELSDKLARYPVWPLCKDVANRVRHFDLRRRPTDKDWSVFQEYLPFDSQIAGTERYVANHV